MPVASPHLAAPRERRAPLLTLRRVRLATGLVLFAYATLHFLNHALGNVSVATMERGLVAQKVVWQSIPGSVVLYVSLFTHMGLGFWALFERRQFRWTRLEATQLVLGLSIPFLLADHFYGTRVAVSLFGTDKGYAEELFRFWVFQRTFVAAAAWSAAAATFSFSLSPFCGALVAISKALLGRIRVLKKGPGGIGARGPARSTEYGSEFRNRNRGLSRGL